MPSSNTAPPPELPRGQGTGSQGSFAGQAPSAQQPGQRQVPQTQGAIAQESSASPAALTLLLLIALLAGIYAYFNREQISEFFKKEEKKAEPVVKEIQKEWHQIVTPPKKHAKQPIQNKKRKKK
jgi:hypothetical protein